jgi:RHS repeat-associated protein
VAKDGVILENAGEQHFYPYGSSVEGEIDDAGYTGHKFDTDLGLSYMQARYYDPMIGRFYSNDPVDALGHLERSGGVSGFNRYNYAYNNPYKYTDPDGNSPFGVVVSPKLGTRISPVAQGVRNGIQQQAAARRAAAENMQRSTDAINRTGNETARNSQGEVRQPSLKESPQLPKDTRVGRLKEALSELADNFGDIFGNASTTPSDTPSGENEMTDDTKRVVAEAQILMVPRVPPSELADGEIL